jgi:hypothetical protein
MVLNDGQTFTYLEGCYVIEVPDDVEEAEIGNFLQSDDAFPNINALFSTFPDGDPFMVGKMIKANATVVLS